MAEAYVYDAVRTPRGKGKKTGSLHTVKPVDLVSTLLDAIKERNPELDPSGVDDLVMGTVEPHGDQGGVLPRTALLANGFSEQVAGTQLNRYCGSGLEAVNQASARVRSGWEDLILAGGVESMSRVPMASGGDPWAMDAATNYATDFVPQGISADLIATIEGFSRNDVDAFAVESQERAAKAWANGHFDRSIIPVTDATGRVILDHDEHMRPGNSVEDLGQLPPVLRRDRRDGRLRRRRAAEVRARRVDQPRPPRRQLLGHRRRRRAGAARQRGAGQRNGLTPRAKIRSAAVVGSEPTIMLTGPAPACRKALDKAGMTIDDIDLVEINEAFASVALKLMRDLGVDHDEHQRQRRRDRHGPPARCHRRDAARDHGRRARASRPDHRPGHAVHRRRHGHRHGRRARVTRPTDSPPPT